MNFILNFYFKFLGITFFVRSIVWKLKSEQCTKCKIFEIFHLTQVLPMSFEDAKSFQETRNAQTNLQTIRFTGFNVL